ncbi:MAG: hypothetical protein JXR76_31185, partial [Deltaproteobacteria bacterium]|nr:hypothetical protein [Deltaproteobacteria bacterium]
MKMTGKKASLVGDDTDSSLDPGLLVMNLPANIHPATVAMAANNQVKINDRTEILKDGGFAAIASAGAAGVEVGANATTGSVVSVGNVFLRDNSTVNGAVYTSGEITHQNIYTITDQENTQIGMNLEPLQKIKMKVSFPADVTQNINVELDQSATHGPGDYGRVAVKSRSTLTLTSGKYTMRELSIEPDATLEIDDSQGPVVLMIRDTFMYKGKVTSVNYDFPHWFVGFAGTSSVFLEKSFSGIIFAPRANVVLATVSNGHRGSFFANNIEAHQATGITHISGTSSSTDASDFATTIWKTVCEEFDAEESDECDVCNKYKTPEPVATSHELNFEIPAGVNPNHIALGANNALTIGNNVSISTTEPFTPSATAVYGNTYVGTGSQLGSVVSVENVEFAGNAMLSGDLLTENEFVNAGNVAVSGTTNDNAVLTPLNSIAFNMVIVEDDEGDIVLEAGREKILERGDYGTVHAKSGSVLYLYSGEYTFKSLVLETGSKVILETVKGQTALYIRDSVLLNAEFEPLGKYTRYNVNGSEQIIERELDLFVGYLGSQTVAPPPTFKGVLAAPSATLELGKNGAGTYSGAFYAENVIVHDNVSILAIESDVSAFSDDSNIDPDAVNVNLFGEEVNLTATDNYQNDGSNCDSVITSGMVEFDIPAIIGVTQGNGGNYPATLTIKTDTGEEIICTYKGGANTAHPLSELEMAKGLEYGFERCTGGHQPKETLMGNEFELCITGDSNSDWPVTEASTSLDKNCNGVIPPVISRAKAVEMLQNFSWQSAPVLSETNDDGYPSLYYMNIFVKDKSQLDMLDAALIHWDTMPLFADEMGRVDNLCGTLDSGHLNFKNLQGQWVFAVVPGAVYNKIREAYFSNQVDPKAKIIFEAMVVRGCQPPTPEGWAYLYESDGSLDYQTLADSGFYYMGLPELPSDAALDEIMQENGKKVRQALISAFRFIRTVVREVVRHVTMFMGEFLRVFTGTSVIKLDVNLTNVDPMFHRYKDDGSNNVLPKEKLQIGWGTSAGKELAPAKMNVIFYQWVPTLAGVFLTSHRGELNSSGKKDLKVGKLGFGGWMVMDYYNDAARITNGTATDRWLGMKSEFNGLKHPDEITINMNTTNDNFLIMAEAINARSYSRNVIGYNPRRATVMRGPNAFILSGFHQHTMAPTLTRTNGIGNLAGLLGVEPLYTGVLEQTDIVVTNSGLHIDGTGGMKSMGLFTHEYGHYISYSLIADFADNPYVLDKIIEEYIGENWGKDSDEHLGLQEETNIVSETLADFIASQVVSGADYFGFHNASNELPYPYGGVAHDMAFCSYDPDHPTRVCADFNQRNAPTDANEMQRILVEMMHDAVDTPNNDKKALVPGRANAWVYELDVSEGVPTERLVYSEENWGDLDDEDVAIFGGGFKTFVHFLAEECETSMSTDVLKIEHFKQALANVLQGKEFGAQPFLFVDNEMGGNYNGGHTWCDACDLFILHQDGLITPPKVDGAPGERFDMQRREFCIARPEITDYIGQPPHPALRMDHECNICPPLHHAVDDPNNFERALCEPCAPGERTLGNSCDPCPVNEKPVGDTCVPCPDDGHFSKTLNDCVVCGEGTGWDTNTEACVPCPADVVVSLNDPNVPDTGRCSHKTYLASQYPTSGDICPDEFWVQFEHLSGTLDDNGTGTTVISVDNRAFEDAKNESDCSDSTMTTTVSTRQQGSTNWTQRIQHVNAGEWDEDVTPEACVYRPVSF